MLRSHYSASIPRSLTRRNFLIMGAGAVGGLGAIGFANSEADGQAPRPVADAFLYGHQIAAAHFFATQSRSRGFIYALLAARTIRQRFPLIDDEVFHKAVNVFSRSVGADNVREEHFEASGLSRGDVLRRTYRMAHAEPGFRQAGLHVEDVCSAMCVSFLSVDHAAARQTPEDTWFAATRSGKGALETALTLPFISRFHQATQGDWLLQQIVDEKFREATGYSFQAASSVESLLKTYPTYAAQPIAKHLETVRQAAVSKRADAIEIANSLLEQHFGYDFQAALKRASEAHAAAKTGDQASAAPATSSKVYSDEEKEKVRNWLNAGQCLGQIGQRIGGDAGEIIGAVSIVGTLSASAVYCCMEPHNPAAWANLALGVVSLFFHEPDRLAQLADQMHRRFDDVVAHQIALDLKLDAYMSRIAEGLGAILHSQGALHEKLDWLRSDLGDLENSLVSHLQGFTQRLDRDWVNAEQDDFQSDVLRYVAAPKTLDRAKRDDAFDCLYRQAQIKSKHDALIGEPIGSMTEEALWQKVAGLTHAEGTPQTGSQADEDRPNAENADALYNAPHSPQLWVNMLRLGSLEPSASLDRVTNLWDLVIQSKSSTQAEFPVDSPRCPDVDAFWLAVQRWACFYDMFPDHEFPRENHLAQGLQPLSESGTGLLSDSTLSKLQQTSEDCLSILNLARDPKRWRPLLERQLKAYRKCVAMIRTIVTTFRQTKMRLSHDKQALSWPFSRDELHRHFVKPVIDGDVNFNWQTGEYESTAKSVAYRSFLDKVYPYWLWTQNRPDEKLHFSKGGPLNEKREITVSSEPGAGRIVLTAPDGFYLDASTKPPTTSLPVDLPREAARLVPHSLIALNYLLRRYYGEGSGVNLRWEGDVNWSAKLARTWSINFTTRSTYYEFEGYPTLSVSIKLYTERNIYGSTWFVGQFSYPNQHQKIFRCSRTSTRRLSNRESDRLKVDAANKIPHPLDVARGGLPIWSATVAPGDIWAGNRNLALDEIYDSCIRIEKDLVNLLVAACDVDLADNDDAFEVALQANKLHLENDQALGGAETPSLTEMLRELRLKARELTAVGQLIKYCMVEFVPDWKEKPVCAFWTQYWKYLPDFPKPHLMPNGTDLANLLRLRFDSAAVVEWARAAMWANPKINADVLADDLRIDARISEPDERRLNSVLSEMEYMGETEEQEYQIDDYIEEFLQHLETSNESRANALMEYWDARERRKAALEQAELARSETRAARKHRPHAASERFTQDQGELEFEEVQRREASANNLVDKADQVQRFAYAGVREVTMHVPAFWMLFEVDRTLADLKDEYKRVEDATRKLAEVFGQEKRRSTSPGRPR